MEGGSRGNIETEARGLVSRKARPIIRLTILLQTINTEFAIKKKKESSRSTQALTIGKGKTRLRLRPTGTQRRALEKPLEHWMIPGKLELSFSRSPEQKSKFRADRGRALTEELTTMN